MAFNMYGGQFNYAKDNATINATQNNGVSGNELDKIIKGIMENLSGLKKRMQKVLKMLLIWQKMN